MLEKTLTIEDHLKSAMHIARVNSPGGPQVATVHALAAIALAIQAQTEVLRDFLRVGLPVETHPGGR